MDTTTITAIAFLECCERGYALTYERFCERIQLSPGSIASQRYKQFRSACNSLLIFDADTISRLLELE